MAIVSSRRSRLDTPDRVGRWSRTRAERLRYEWALRNWRLLVGVFSTFAALGVLMLLVPFAGYDVLAGAVFASGGWAVAGLVYAMSGSAPLSMGNTAEAWTAHGLRRLRQSGWQVAHGVRLRPGADIDHVAIGSGGLVVVETKWRSDGWVGRFAEERTGQAIEQVGRNARDLRLMFPRVQPVIPLVVLWGHPGPPDPIRVVGDVTIIDGTELADWLVERAAGSLETLDPAEVEKAWQLLNGHVQRRDLHDEATQPAHANLDRIVNQVVAGTIAGILSFLAFTFVSETWAVPLSGATAFVTWRFRHRSRHSLALAAAALTAGVPAVGLLILVASTFALRLLT